MTSHEEPPADTKTLSATELSARVAPSADRVFTTSKMTLFASVPERDCEFKAMFSSKIVSQNDLECMQRWTNSAKKAGFVFDQTSKSVEGFNGFVDHSNSQITVVIGHNLNGHFFFSDGSSAKLTDMAERFRQKGSMAVFLSCESSRYVDGCNAAVGVNSELTFDQAFAIYDNIRSLCAGRDTVSFRSVHDSLPGFEKAVLGSDRVKLVARYVVSGTVIALVIYAVDSATPDKKSDDRKTTGE